ncbi:MAG TPA: hypothetical protein PK689_06735, partial [Kiritimatiellia bacterium]|nr:hypothetical protein [Kiritimatiellia bacterium]
NKAQDAQRLGLHIRGIKPIEPYSGVLQVKNGMIQPTGITLLHARSVAENVRVLTNKMPYSGTLDVDSGKLVPRNAKLSERISGSPKREFPHPGPQLRGVTAVDAESTVGKVISFRQPEDLPSRSLDGSLASQQQVKIHVNRSRA